jgi:hypothetical protein
MLAGVVPPTPTETVPTVVRPVVCVNPFIIFIYAPVFESVV